MTDLDIFPRHELIRQSRRHKRAAAGHVVMPIGNLAVLFLDRSTPRRGVPRMVGLMGLLKTVGSGHQQLIASDGVVGPGTLFYDQVVGQQLEGVVAKRLASRYLPGRRTGAWIKIKPSMGHRPS